MCRALGRGQCLLLGAQKPEDTALHQDAAPALFPPLPTTLICGTLDSSYLPLTSCLADTSLCLLHVSPSREFCLQCSLLWPFPSTCSHPSRPLTTPSQPPTLEPVTSPQEAPMTVFSEEGPGGRGGCRPLHTVPTAPFPASGLRGPPMATPGAQLPFTTAHPLPVPPLPCRLPPCQLLLCVPQCLLGPAHLLLQHHTLYLSACFPEPSATWGAVPFLLLWLFVAWS